MKQIVFELTLNGQTQDGQERLSHFHLPIMTLNTYCGQELVTFVCLMGFKWEDRYHCHGS